MKLVIVESPTKAKTLQNFLGKGFLVKSSFGHVRDLPKKELGVDVEKDFEPKYVIPQKAKEKVKDLKQALKETSSVILATDEDREGESIAFHLKEALKLKNPDRIVFHEITKNAVSKALKTPRKIDNNLVNAQKARRILDRLVGYKLSPFLWKKVLRGLSAGRVQSVAVKLICEREKEIAKFKPEEYWSLKALFEKGFEAELEKKERIKEKEVNEIVKELEKAQYKIIDIEKKQEKRKALPPFQTSTLQQTSSRRLNFTSKKTMRLAQMLYEKGLITYHRTDSLNLSQESRREAKALIENKFGKEYYTQRVFKSKSKSAQEAHEAIRPTRIQQEPMIKDKNEKALYNLIWQRFIASQMTDAVFNNVRVNIKAKEHLFKTTGQTLKFAGFLKVYPIKYTETELPYLKEGEILELKELKKEQHFTKPPSRYSEPSLIKVLEEKEIGRPSTYAVILDTIQERGYVEKNEDKKFTPTKIGTIVNDILTKHFPEIVDIGFTAQMEKELDEIAKGKDTWIKTLKDFYFPFEKNLKKKEKEVEKKDLTEKTDKICPECKSPMVIRMGRYGKFFACSRFPHCKHTESLPPESLGMKCPKCKKGEIIEKRTKRKTVFYGCSNWPKCDFALWNKPTGKKCPQCGSLLTEKQGKIECSNQGCDFSKKDAQKTS